MKSTKPFAKAVALLACVFAAFALGTACVTARFDTLPGMVYDSSGRPINGAEIRSGDRVIAASDVNGRFSLTPEGEGSYRIGKPGYETRELPLEGETKPGPDTAIYVRLESREDLIAAAWDALEAQRFDEARRNLDRALSIAEAGPDWAITNLALLVLDPSVPPPEARAFREELRSGAYGAVSPSWLEPFGAD